MSKLAASYNTFGTYLGIPLDKLEELEKPITSDECMHKTLNWWVKLKRKAATIEILIAAVRSPIIDNEALAQAIERNPKMREGVCIHRSSQ